MWAAMWGTDMGDRHGRSNRERIKGWVADYLGLVAALLVLVIIFGVSARQLLQPRDNLPDHCQPNSRYDHRRGRYDVRADHRGDRPVGRLGHGVGQCAVLGICLGQLGLASALWPLSCRPSLLAYYAGGSTVCS